MGLLKGSPMELARETQPQRPRESWFKSVLELAVHIVVGSLIFLVVALPAALLNILTEHLTQWGVDSTIAIGLRVSGYAILLADLILFLVFIARTSYRFMRQQWDAT